MMLDLPFWIIGAALGGLIGLACGVVFYIAGPAAWAHIRHPLLIMLSLVAAASAVLVVTGDDTTQRYVDRPMLILICTAYGLACLSILARTNFVLWTILGAGLLATMAGDAGLYGWIFASRQWPGVAPHAHTVLAVVRSLLLVGSAFVVIGLAREKWVLDHANDRQGQQDKRQDRQNARGGRQDRRELRQDIRSDKLDVRDSEPP